MFTFKGLFELGKEYSSKQMKYLCYHLLEMLVATFRSSKTIES